MDPISVAARASPLSKAQLQEVHEALQRFFPEIQFLPHYTESTGDKDLKTSLRTVAKTDFFTREIDQLVLNGTCQIAIHSAKDLPETLSEDLKIIAITPGVDPKDSLVMRKGETIHTLPKGAIIATSSEKRESAVKALRQDFTFIDVRGPIHDRLKLLENKADGVVIAEAAILRLNLLSLNRIRLPGLTTPLQGQLAIIAQRDDAEMEFLFRPLDSRLMKKSVYLGPEYPLKRFLDRFILHLPAIRIEPLYSEAIDDILTSWHTFSHLIFTSRNGVKTLIERLQQKNISLESLKKKSCLCIGEATASQLLAYGILSIAASLEQAEGVVDLLKKQLPADAHVLWICSQLSRPLIGGFLRANKFSYSILPIYRPVALEKFEPIEYQDVKEIIFSSPSTVHAFFKHTSKLPKHLMLTPIGPITAQTLAEYSPFQENESEENSD